MILDAKSIDQSFHYQGSPAVKQGYLCGTYFLLKTVISHGSQ